MIDLKYKCCWKIWRQWWKNLYQFLINWWYFYEKWDTKEEAENKLYENLNRFSQEYNTEIKRKIEWYKIDNIQLKNDIVSMWDFWKDYNFCETIKWFLDNKSIVNWNLKMEIEFKNWDYISEILPTNIFNNTKIILNDDWTFNCFVKNNYKEI